jgi:hypothetical protein
MMEYRKQARLKSRSMKSLVRFANVEAFPIARGQRVSYIKDQTNRNVPLQMCMERRMELSFLLVKCIC